MGNKPPDTSMETTQEESEEVRTSFFDILDTFEITNQITLDRQAVIDRFFETSLPKTPEAFQAYLEENN